MPVAMKSAVAVALKELITKLEHFIKPIMTKENCQ